MDELTCNSSTLKHRALYLLTQATNYVYLVEKKHPSIISTYSIPYATKIFINTKTLQRRSPVNYFHVPKLSIRSVHDLDFFLGGVA